MNNTGKWIAGGIVAGILLFILGFIGNIIIGGVLAWFVWNLLGFHEDFGLSALTQHQALVIGVIYAIAKFFVKSTVEVRSK